MEEQKEQTKIWACRNCAFFGQRKSELGECHRYAPRSKDTAWPTVLADDWCGEFEPNMAVRARELVEAQLAEAQAQVAALREWLENREHESDCVISVSMRHCPDDACTCGLTAHLRDLAAAADAHDHRIRAEERERLAIIADQIGTADADAIADALRREPGQ